MLRPNAMDSTPQPVQVASPPLPHRLVLSPRRGWQVLDLRELWRYRELAYFLCWRDIKVRYKQTLLGALWAVIQPLCQMVVFSAVFGRVAELTPEGVPYPIFLYSGLLVWHYFANGLHASGNSLVNSAHVIGKVYFPRVLAPGAAALAGLVDFAIASVILACLMVHYEFVPGWSILLAPYLVFCTFLTALGFGLWLSALNVQYRDVRHAMPFIIQTGMFVTPVIYPVSILPDQWEWVLYLNPMAGLIENLRACVLGTSAIDWSTLAHSNGLTLLVLISGVFYFSRVERTFADVI